MSSDKRSKFGTWERALAGMLSRSPRAKARAKRIYQRILYRFYRKPYRKNAIYPVRSLEDSHSNSFYGYYDRTPENDAGLVLACITSNTTSQFSCIRPIEVTVFDKQGNPLTSVDTTAYNWQQGARAIWLSKEHFIFNDIDSSERAVAKVFSVPDKKVVREYSLAVQDAYRERYFISLNYSRISFLQPEYGYQSISPLDENAIKKLDTDGIWKVDIQSGSYELLYSLEAAVRLPAVRDFTEGLHLFNHVTISPNGERFIVVHRRYIQGRRDDRLLVCRSAGDEMRVLIDNGMVSHCTWISNSQILGYVRGPNGRDGYWLVDVESGIASPVAEGKLDSFGDGHPHSHGDWFVTDTYPDKAAMQSLLLCNWRTSEVRRLGEFFHGLSHWAETRCDLHPRFSPDGRRIYFDSVFSGERKLYMMELPEL